MANVSLNHARELARTFRVSLISEGFPSEQSPGIDRLELKSHDFSYLRRFSHVPREILFALSAKSTVKKLHRTVPIDWVICHGHPVATIALVPLQRKLGLPYVLVTHGDIFERPRGTYDTRLTWFYEKTTPYAYRHADLVVALSPYMASRAVDGGANRDRVVIIPNGIDPVEIGLTDSGSDPRANTNDRLDLLYVGRLSVEKGVDVLLEAIALLMERGSHLHLKIVGTGRDESRLRALVERRNLKPHVEFLGHVARDQLGPLYRSSDVVCVPSRSDPLPTVALEAMVSGIPVVGSDTGGIPFLVQDGETGFVHPPEDPTLLADALDRFAKDGSLSRRMGDAARAHAMRHFTWPAAADRLAGELVARCGER